MPAAGTTDQAPVAASPTAPLTLRTCPCCGGTAFRRRRRGWLAERVEIRADGHVRPIADCAVWADDDLAPIHTEIICLGCDELFLGVGELARGASRTAKVRYRLYLRLYRRFERHIERLRPTP